MREVTSGRTKAVPTRLIITIGGFGGPHYEVRLQHGRLQYRTDGSQVTVAPSVQEWDAFWAEMSRIEVWSWDAQYVDPEIMDGTQWSLDLSDGARSVRCFGDNAYPRLFRAFLAAVRALTGQPFG